MTVIAAVATHDRVVMGCDTRADYGGTAVYLADGKIEALKASNGDRVLLGWSGHAGVLSVLRRDLALPSVPPDVSGDSAVDSWAGRVAEAITDTLVDARPALTCDDGDGATAIDGNGLLAWRNRLWLLQTHAAIRPRTGIHALGSGMDVALGALYASLAAGVEVGDAVDSAVRLAADFAVGCGIDDRGPIVYSTVGD